MTILKLTTGKEHNIRMLVTPATIQKVEKWSDTSISVSNNVSGGGGYIYQGSGYVDPVSFSTTTSTVNTRHTRIYYKAADKSDAISAYGFDLPVIEEAKIDIVWYACDGFGEKIAGFLDHRANTWFMLNSPQEYFMSWLGISWVNIPYIKKHSLIIGVVVLISFLLNLYLGLVTTFFGGLYWYYALGKSLIKYLKERETYAHFDDMMKSDSELRKEFLQVLNLSR